MEFGHSTSNENKRLHDLDAYEIMDTPPELSFDQFTYMASSLCQTPIALLSFIDDERQWFKSTYGLEIHELPKHISACNQTIKQSEAFIIEDSHNMDCEFSSFMKSEGLRFYAGVPITSHEGHQMGALCVIDYRPRTISDDQIKGLEVLSKQIVEILDIRKKYVDTLNYLKEANENSYEKDKLAQDVAHRAAMKAMAELSSGLSYRIKPLILSLNKDWKGDLETFQKTVRKNNKIILETLESLEKFVDAEKEKAMKPVNLGEIINGVIKHSEWKLTKFGVKLTSNIEEDVILVANSSQISQVFFSVLENAIEAQIHGEKKIHVQMSSKDHVATIRVSDFGEGVVEENRSFIFLPFFTTKTADHLGIGLSLAQALIQRHSGEIHLVSNHHPTIFEIKLPVP